jgi:PhzF family phenazine biosynthesis protein
LTPSAHEEKMKLETFFVNSFTTNLAEGNPAGVVIYDEIIPDDLLLKIAIDIGKSETAFIKKTNNNYYSIRWFSPKKEMPICGHATLAAAKVLFSIKPVDEITFISSNDKLLITKKNESITMKFPIDDYNHVPTEAIYFDFFPEINISECIIGKRTKKVILIVPKETNIRTLKPVYHIMEMSKGIYSNGIGISKKSSTYDFESRYFNPWAGVNEDPITGSVHTVLAQYWSKKLHKNKMTAAQLSHRPGILELMTDNNSVYISGKARIVISGIIEI